MSSVRVYILTYAALLFLVGATLGLAFVPIGPNGRFNAAVALAIAFAKAWLIATYFMHLKHEKGAIRVFAFAGIAWLLILFALSLADYGSRDWLLLPGNWPT